MPDASFINVGELCVSDTNKTLLLANPGFLPYLLDGLLTNADHPRLVNPEYPARVLSHEGQAWLQTCRKCSRSLCVFFDRRSSKKAAAIAQTRSASRS